MNYPKISVITPSYNQGQFIEETIQSVLNQKYPNLEYVIIDGGSTDNSVEIIKKYEKYLTYWVSEKDRGQTDAIVKGFKRSSGTFLTWLNSDDTYLNGVLTTIGETVAMNPDADVIYGDYVITDQKGRPILQKKEIEFDFDVMLYGVNMIGQPAAFFSRKIYDKAGGLDISFNYFMDVELWLRIANNNGKFKHIKKMIATYRFHPNSKTIVDFSVSEKCKRESQVILDKYWSRMRFSSPTIHELHYHYLRTINRVKRQYTKIIYRGTIDFIPGKYFMWFYKKFILDRRALL